MKCKLFIIFIFLFATKAFSQCFYLKQIQDSTKAGIFGQVAFMDQDSLNLYLVTNTTYSSGYCSNTTGLNYVLKVSKQSGNIISSNAITGNPLATKITSGLKLNNALYLGGEMSDLTSRYAVLAKYSLLSNQIVWTLPLDVYSTPWNYISTMKFNSNKTNIVFNGIASYFGLPSNYVGFVDTLGTLGPSANYGLKYLGSGGQLTNSKFDFSSLDTKFYTVANDFYSDSVYMVKNLNWNLYGQIKKVNLKSDGNQYAVSLSKYILNIVNYNNSFTCFIVDTSNNIVKAKKFSNIYFKSVGTDKGKAVLNCVNVFASGKGNQIINIKIDSVLNILSSKKFITDTFGVTSLTSSTIFNKVSDTYFNLISKKFAYNPALQLYKSNFSGLYCGELTYTPTVSVVSLTSTLCVPSATGGVGTATPSLLAFQKGFIDSLICNAFQGINEFSYSKSDISIYPNPAKSNINILVKDYFYEKSKLEVRITDIYGREILSDEMKGIVPKEINLEACKCGIYFVNIYSEGQLIRVEKVVKSD